MKEGGNMEDQFRQIDPERITGNVFRMIDKDWMLITAGKAESFNMMTASWGGLGVLWHKPAAFCFVRPTRHTYGFMEQNEFFSLCFFAEQHRKALEFCGTKSGRQVDKAKETGLSPVRGVSGAVYFRQARLVLECRKIYHQDIDPQKFLDPEIHKSYPIKDYHRMYVGQVMNCLSREQ
jgi:flavin reductase (DIM6/NTAB) family NADH-FMN oxidoreductase RutF